MTDPILNRVLVVIEGDYEGEHRQRTTVERRFETDEFTTDLILGAVGDALRGHGFHCPSESPVIIKEDEDVVTREK